MESTTVLKALGLLEALATTQRGRSLAELALELQLPKPTAHRLLKTLSLAGYVAKGEPGCYCAGPALDRLTVRGADDILRDLALPALEKLHKATRETVNLGVLRHGYVVYLEVLESPQPLRRVVTANSTDPFYCTALGRAIAAEASPAEIDHLLAGGPFRKRTPHTVVDPPLLRGILQETHRLGYSIEIDQTDLGVTCLAAPILDNGVKAAISLSIPSPRADDKSLAKILKLVQQTAAKIGNLLKKETSKRPIVGKDR
jgi:DNA-binding IclR family transcriptional regulator